jgi:cytochrome c-type biogenesis protein CcmH/NrfG
MNPASAILRAKTSKVKAIQAAELKKYLALSQAELTKGDLKTALLNLENAYRVDSSNVEVKDGLFKTKREIRGKVDSLLSEGTSLFDAGDKIKSKQKFEAVLTLDPNNEKANEFIQKMTGQQAQEKVDADKVKSLYYEGVNNYINGNIHDAVQKWQECLKLDPSNVNAKENINKAMAKLQSIEQLNHN